MEERDEPSKKQNMPEFVFIDDGGRSEEPSWGGAQSEYYSSFRRISRERYPIAVRIIFLFLAFFIAIALAIAAIFWAAVLALNLVTFLQISRVRMTARKSWELVRKASVVFLGLLVAVFSPPLGISIMMVYFLYLSHVGDDEFFSRYVRARMKRFQ